MGTLLRSCICIVLIQVVTCACKNGAKPCEWEPWQPWSSCSRTCGVGYRTRNRNMCCGPILKDCVNVCYGDKENMQSHICHKGCPNGATLVGDLCQCPPLKYGVCCDKDESAFKGVGGCARHCIWTHWYSWGVCSTKCGCGTRERKRTRCCSRNISNNGTLCEDDCNLKGNIKETSSCTKACPYKSGPDGCSLCSWNNWGSWSSCSSTCGGGQRSRSRSPCCCNGQMTEDCQADCGLSDTGANQKKACNQLCFNGGSYTDNSNCSCKAGFAGKCCSTEVTVGNCKKCSWQAWQALEETGEDGKMRRKRELCCRIGQSAEGCRSECRAEEHSQVQILSHVEQLDEAGTNLTSTSSDQHLYLYTGGSSLASVIVTSLLWACCRRLKKIKSGKTMDSGPENKPGNVYKMSSRGQEIEAVYEDLDAEECDYVNIKY